MPYAQNQLEEAIGRGLVDTSNILLSRLRQIPSAGYAYHYYFNKQIITAELYRELGRYFLYTSMDERFVTLPTQLNEQLVPVLDVYLGEDERSRRLLAVHGEVIQPLQLKVLMGSGGRTGKGSEEELLRKAADALGVRKPTTTRLEAVTADVAHLFSALIYLNKTTGIYRPDITSLYMILVHANHHLTKDNSFPFLGQMPELENKPLFLKILQLIDKLDFNFQDAPPTSVLRFLEVNKEHYKDKFATTTATEKDAKAGTVTATAKAKAASAAGSTTTAAAGTATAAAPQTHQPLETEEPPSVIKYLRQDLPNDVAVTVCVQNPDLEFEHADHLTYDVVCKAPSTARFAELIKFFEPLATKGMISKNEAKSELTIKGVNRNTAALEAFIFRANKLGTVAGAGKSVTGVETATAAAGTATAEAPQPSAAPVAKKA